MNLQEIETEIVKLNTEIRELNASLNLKITKRNSLLETWHEKKQIKIKF